MVIAYWVIYHAYDETTARTSSDVFALFELGFRDLETVSTRARIVINAFGGIPCHVFNLDLVIVCTHLGRIMGVVSK